VKISVRVKPNSRTEGVDPSGDGGLTVRVGAPPAEGRANERLIELLAAHFKLPKRRISIIRGSSARNKVVEISGLNSLDNTP